ncbi:YdiU family protein [Methylophilaceae bacterium]|nr:YdiU family protein [Methylophilaceae bacterium]
MNYLDTWQLENSYADLPKQFYTPINPTPVNKPNLVIFNKALSKELGIDLPDDKELLAQIFSGNKLPKKAKPISQAYAGHQFGHFSILGDGRAHLIGEQISANGKRFDIQFKGSGPTPYSRNGDGRAALAPMLREYIISEAMYALNIPTTRSLSVVSTGESIMRSSLTEGAILTRIAASHIRVGTFEYASKMLDRSAVKELADYAIKRHFPELISQENPYLSFLRAVITQQAKLIASWMHIGFIHGVMNTDNMAISGETIDYGPCAFMDIFSMNKVFSSIDQNGRYEYGSQAHIAHWNLTKLTESLLPLLHENTDEAMNLAEVAISEYANDFNSAWISGMRAKLGLLNEEEGDYELAQNLLEWMESSKADYTETFRDLTYENLTEKEIYKSLAFKRWHSLWQGRLSRNLKPIKSALSMMRKYNPVIVPYNHLVEEALAAAEEGDMNPFFKLLSALEKPFEFSPSNEIFLNSPLDPNPYYQTFCGT